MFHVISKKKFTQELFCWWNSENYRLPIIMAPGKITLAPSSLDGLKGLRKADKLIFYCRFRFNVIWNAKSQSLRYDFNKNLFDSRCYYSTMSKIVALVELYSFNISWIPMKYFDLYHYTNRGLYILGRWTKIRTSKPCWD